MRNNYTVSPEEGTAEVAVWDYLTRDVIACRIDIEDLGIVQSVAGTWITSPAGHGNDNWYAMCKVWTPGKGSRTVMMHRLIMGITDRATHVHHLNHLGLDNRRDNLQPMPIQEHRLLHHPDMAARKQRKTTAGLYRLERQLARAVQAQYALSRQGLWHIRTGLVTNSQAAKAYTVECITRGIPTLAQLKTSSPVTGPKWGAVRAHQR